MYNNNISILNQVYSNCHVVSEQDSPDRYICDDTSLIRTDLGMENMQVRPDGYIYIGDYCIDNSGANPVVWCN